MCSQVRMLRFSRHSRLKCRKSSFWEQKHCFWAFLRPEDWRLRTEDSLFTSYDWPHFQRPQKFSKILINWKILKARLAGLHNGGQYDKIVTSMIIHPKKIVVSYLVNIWERTTYFFISLQNALQRLFVILQNDSIYGSRGFQFSTSMHGCFYWWLNWTKTMFIIETASLKSWGPWGGGPLYF